MQYPPDVIEVTEEDIARGCKDIIEPGGCPIALAMTKAGYTEVEVWYDDVYFKAGAGAMIEHVKWPDHISEWQQGGVEKERKPFEFSVNELRALSGRSIR